MKVDEVLSNLSVNGLAYKKKLVAKFIPLMTKVGDQIDARKWIKQFHSGLQDFTAGDQQQDETRMQMGLSYMEDALKGIEAM